MERKYGTIGGSDVRALLGGIERFRAHKSFILGDNEHTLYGNFAEEKMRQLPPHKFDNFMTINGWKLTANVDGFDGKELHEYKTINKGGEKEIVSKYKWQAQFYILACQISGYDIDCIKFRYMVKPDEFIKGFDISDPSNYVFGEIKEFVYKPHKMELEHLMLQIKSFCEREKHDY